jgi:type IV fimbrial biogenesis protein FimT
MDVRAITRGRARGLTAIELITTVAVAIVLLAAGIPGLRGMLVRQEVTVAVTEIMTHLQLARISAVTSGHRIVMCPTDDGRQCADTFEWAGGFMVFEDRDADRELDPAEPLLRYTDPGLRGVRITTSTGRRKVVYQPEGTAGGTNATFRICPTSERGTPRTVIISNTGRPRVAEAESDGTPVKCS